MRFSVLAFAIDSHPIPCSQSKAYAKVWEKERSRLLCRKIISRLGMVVVMHNVLKCVCLFIWPREEGRVVVSG